eukprot:scaffold16885_cov81-Isochrysis_galbana.AAC.2
MERRSRAVRVVPAKVGPAERGRRREPRARVHIGGAIRKDQFGPVVHVRVHQRVGGKLAAPQWPAGRERQARWSRATAPGCAFVGSPALASALKINDHPLGTRGRGGRVPVEGAG